MHDKALEAAARAVNPLAWTRDGHWDRHGRRFDRDRSEWLARAAILAFLDAVEVTDATVAAVQRDERWSSFWSPDDAKALIECALAQLRREIAGGDREAPILPPLSADNRG